MSRMQGPKWDFERIQLDCVVTFENLYEASSLERTGKGRCGCNLVVDDGGLVPIVRTTTVYEQSVQRFAEVHRRVREAIYDKLAVDGAFHLNNAMMEVYDSTYRKMGFHTDQTQDLDGNSLICVFSCYENASNHASDLRKLVVESKSGDTETRNIDMLNNSIIVFSSQANATHRHKIVLKSNGQPKNRWLGITFRCSKTFIEYKNGEARFTGTDIPLRLASEADRKELLGFKSKENATDGPFEYPFLDYTISASDLLPPQN